MRTRCRLVALILTCCTLRVGEPAYSVLDKPRSKELTQKALVSLQWVGHQTNQIDANTASCCLQRPHFTNKFQRIVRLKRMSPGSSK